MKSVFTALLFTLLLSATSFSQAVTCESQTFIYSADSANPQSVQSYCLQADGQLVAISGSPFSTGGSGAFGGSTSANRGIVSKDGSRMYVSNDQFGNSGFSGFVINKTTGVLTPMSGSPWFLGDSSHAGSSFALSPDGRYLYLTRNNAKGLKIYSLDETSGAPTEIGDISFATTPNSSPNGMELSPDGKWLAINFNTGNFLAMYSVGSDGLLTPVPGSVYTLPNYPMSVVFHPMKQILYVTTLAQSIFVYDIAVDGQLSLGQTLSTTAFAPRVIYISSDERFIYGTSETAGTIQRFSLNTETGRINALESTLNVTSGTSLLALSKNGDYLFSKGLNVPISTFSITSWGI